MSGNGNGAATRGVRGDGFPPGVTRGVRGDGFPPEAVHRGTRADEHDSRVEGLSTGWTVFSYLIGGMIAYGAIGWLIGKAVHVGLLFPIGMLVGLAISLGYVIYRFGRQVTLDEQASALRLGSPERQRAVAGQQAVAGQHAADGQRTVGGQQAGDKQYAGDGRGSVERNDR